MTNVVVLVFFLYIIMYADVHVVVVTANFSTTCVVFYLLRCVLTFSSLLLF